MADRPEGTVNPAVRNDTVMEFLLTRRSRPAKTLKAPAPDRAALRPILRDCGLDEALKWAKPCYTFDGANVAIIQPFKACCALMFFKGSLLEDPEGVLVKQGENSQAAMRMEFTSVAQVDALQATLRSYVAEAVALEKAGAKVDFKDKRELAKALPKHLLLIATHALVADARSVHGDGAACAPLGEAVRLASPGHQGSPLRRPHHFFRNAS